MMPHRAAAPRECGEAPHTASGQDAPAVPPAIVGEGSGSRLTLVPYHGPLFRLILTRLLHYNSLGKQYLYGFIYSIPSHFLRLDFWNLCPVMVIAVSLGVPKWIFLCSRIGVVAS